MNIIKRGWSMLITNGSQESGFYHADNRIVERMDLNFRDLEKDVLETAREDTRMIRLSYLVSKGKIKGVLEDEIEVLDDGIVWKARVRAVDDVEISPIFEIDYTLEDVMEMRGFSTDKIRRLERHGNRLVYSSNRVKLEIRENVDLKPASLTPGQTWSGEFEIRVDYSTSGIHSDILKKDCPELETDDAVSKLLVCTRFGWIPVAGLPWYGTFFGRDLLVFSLFALDRSPELVSRILRFLARTQAERFDDARDMQPGKIFHEMRFAVSSLEGDNPFDLYYGSVDATLLFPVVAWRYLEKTGDTDLIEDIYDNLNSAIEWALNYGDIDGDGFVEYETSGVLRNKGWKDSDDAVVEPDGSSVEGPIALVEVQGYLYCALESMGKMHEIMGNTGRSREMLEISRHIRKKFQEHFSTHDYFALALDGDKKRVETITSNPANALFTGIFDEDSARKVVRRVRKEDLLTPFGIRTMSSRETAFHPISYHRGSIWPHDNALIALGMYENGFENEARDISRRLLRASENFDGKLPELFVYVDGMKKPLPYPEACEIQLWALESLNVFEKILSQGVVS